MNNFIKYAKVLQNNFIFLSTKTVFFIAVIPEKPIEIDGIDASSVVKQRPVLLEQQRSRPSNVEKQVRKSIIFFIVIIKATLPTER